MATGARAAIGRRLMTCVAVAVLGCGSVWAAGPNAPRALIAPESAPAAQADNPIDQNLADSLAAFERLDYDKVLSLMYLKPGTDAAVIVPAGLKVDIAVYRLRRMFEKRFPEAPLPPMLNQPTSPDMVRTFLNLPKRDRPVTINGDTAVTQRYFDPIEVAISAPDALKMWSGAKIYFIKDNGVWKCDAARTFKFTYDVGYADPAHARATPQDVAQIYTMFAQAVDATAAALGKDPNATAEGTAQALDQHMQASFAKLQLTRLRMQQEPVEPGTGLDTAPLP